MKNKVNKKINDLIEYPKKRGLYDPINEHDSCGFGFIANINNEPKHEIVHQALEIVNNLDHRGAKGSDPLAGDGAGILIQIPHLFFSNELNKKNIKLPSAGNYAVGMVFLPRDELKLKIATKIIESIVKLQNQKFLCWRDVPVNNKVLGLTVKENEPLIKQFFIKTNTLDSDLKSFQRSLFIIRKQIEKNVIKNNIYDLYIPSFSSSTIVYKGMVLAPNLAKYYKDFQDKNFKTSLALFHQRFSTNTFPSWRLAQPFRYLCHNGEINTVKGNINWMNSRKNNLKSDKLGNNLNKIWPIIENSPSDSSTFDNALELLIMGGYSLSHAMMLMIPEAWQNNVLMDEDKKAFYEYFSGLMEPWDGPAAMAFTDGFQIAATLDRNGLRPARYIVTDDGLIIMASEVGVLPNVPEEKIVKKWRLQPGKMLLVDLHKKRIISDEEIKNDLKSKYPYKNWVRNNRVKLSDISKEKKENKIYTNIANVQKSFGYTKEDLKFFIEPMSIKAEDPIGSMGRDIPLAPLSDKSRLLFDYFFQNFAQVTNPPIDPIREELVMSLLSFIGPKPNLLEISSGENFKRLQTDQPILSNSEINKIKFINETFPESFKSLVISICVDKTNNISFTKELKKICDNVEKAISKDNFNIIILSDKDVSDKKIPIPSLLATSAVHHHLIKKGLRTSSGLIIETGEARRVHDMCLLSGYGAEAINPYLAFDTISNLFEENNFDISIQDAHVKYVKALNKGMLKVMSKMGISTIQSYCGAQIFDAVGLSTKLINQYFLGTSSKVEGVGIKEIQFETESRHLNAFINSQLEIGGDLSYRINGEEHVWNPETIKKLQHAVRSSNYLMFKDYSKSINDQSIKFKSLRGLLCFKKLNKSIQIKDVEPASEIVKRFATGAMSLGSISTEAHSTLAIAMNRLGGRSNTGEGGEEASRFKTLSNGDSMKSRIKQVASGRFGVTTEYLVNATDIQIKMAQGAKPGEGGQLPGHKVDEFIAKVRHSTPGVGLISPPPHHDIYSIEDLAQLIFDLKNVNPKARISVKLVSEVGVGTVAAGVSKAHADHVTISGHDGGTGASPITSVLNAGSPWEIGLAETHQTLVMNNLRTRIAVQVDGGLRTGRDVIVGALLGADEFGFATAALISEGCIMMRKCHLNTCPVGVATQDPELRKKFTGKPEHIVNFFMYIAEEVREIMADLGFKKFDHLIGQRQYLNFNNAKNHWKANKLDLSKIIYNVIPETGSKTFNCEVQDHKLENVLDKKIINDCIKAINNHAKVELNYKILNINRSVGTMLSGEIALKHGHEGLPKNSIIINFIGNAGQSFGAWLAKGVTFNMEGDTNDYLGKGLSGGIISVKASSKNRINSEANIIAGNTLLYGAISGECYINGMVGERFAVRNSGAYAVVEGCGDHGCEYMTGGIVVVLGETGRNFAAGMSGGIAYVLDENNDFRNRCNLSMVDLSNLSNSDSNEDFDIDEISNDLLNFDEIRLKRIIEKHLKHTNSLKAKLIIDNWSSFLTKFVKITPFEFKRVLEDKKNNDDTLKIVGG